MSKVKTQKEIVETARNTIAKQYKSQIEKLKSSRDDLLKSNIELMRRCIELSEKVATLEEENNQYRDWIERLQQFCDMPEDMREKEIEKMKAESKYNRFANYFNSEAFNAIIQMFEG